MKIGIIGAGKVGIATGSIMIKKGLSVVAVSDRLTKALDAARPYLGATPLYTTDNEAVIEIADVIAITTQDGAVSGVAREIADRAGTLDGKLFFHTSGAHSSVLLSPLAQKGALIGALHPLQTFPDIESAIRALPETYIFVEGSNQSLQTLKLIGEQIGRKVVEIEGKNKVLYHLCAVFVCNLLCALMYSSERIMEKIDITLEPFFPIINATLRNIEHKGPLLSLTGPVVRGDAGTLSAHMDAMEDMEEHKEIYKALSLVALDMVRKRGFLHEEAIESMRKVLQGI